MKRKGELTGLRAVLCGALVAMSVGCPGEEPGPAPASTEIVEGFDLSGVYVMVEPQGGSSTFNLWDPRTNKTSALQYPLSGFNGTVLTIDASPDGRYLAHVNPAGVIIVTRIIDDGGVPSLEEVTSIQPSTVGRYVKFNPYGDRLHTDTTWFNLETGEFTECSDLEPIQALPDGYHYMCGPTLYRDGVVAAERLQPAWYGWDVPVHGEQNHPVDGQLVKGVQLDPVAFAVTSDPAAALELPPLIPWNDGTIWLSETATNGKVVGLQLGNDGDSTPASTCVTSNSDALPRKSSVGFPQASFAQARVVGENALWDLSVMDELNVGHDSRVFTPHGLHPANGEVIYTVTYRDIVPPCDNLPVKRRLVRVSPDGTMTHFDQREQFGELVGVIPPLGRPWEGQELFFAFGVGTVGNDVLLPSWPIAQDSAGIPRSFTGWVDDVPTRFHATMADARGVGMLGRRYLEDELAFHVCREPVKAPGQATCVRREVSGVPMLVTAHGVMAGDDVDSPIVQALSHYALPAGATLTIFGAGFGNAGSLRIGELSVASASATLWTDQRIEVVVGEDWPELGRLVVESGGKTSAPDGALELRFGRTLRVSTPLDAMADPLILQQGLNRVALDVPPETQIIATELDADGLYSIFSEGSDETADSLLAVATDAHVRIYTQRVEPGIVDPTQWQPVAVGAAEDGVNPPKGLAIQAGELLDLDNGVRLRLGERMLFDEVQTSAPTAPMPLGIPSQFWETPHGTFSYDLTLFRGFLNRITGWDDTSGVLAWNLAMPAATGLQGAPYAFGFTDGFAIAITTDAAMPDQTYYQLSSDGGLTFGARVDAAEQLFFPAALRLESGPAALALRADGSAVLVDATGESDASVTVDAGAFTGLDREQRVYSSGSAAVYHLPGRQPWAVDMSDASPELAPIDLGGNVVSVFHDRDANTLRVVLDDGRIFEAPFDGALGDFVEVPLAVTLPDGSTLTPAHAVRVDGRWVVRGRVESEARWANQQWFWALEPLP